MTIKTIGELEDATQKVGQSDYSDMSNSFIEAMNDWPTFNLNEIDLFIKEVQSTFGKPLTIKRLESIKFNGNNAWQLESAAGLIEFIKKASKKSGITTVEEGINELLEFFQNYPDRH